MHLDQRANGGHLGVVSSRGDCARHIVGELSPTLDAPRPEISLDPAPVFATEKPHRVARDSGGGTVAGGWSAWVTNLCPGWS
jgi:hypothetical protein